MVLKGPDDRWAIYSFAGAPPRLLPGIDPKDEIVQWSADGEILYTTRYGELPMKVYRYRIATATRELWKEITPAERAGLVRIENLAITPDGNSYAYSYNRVLASDLYAVSGWK